MSARNSKNEAESSESKLPVKPDRVAISKALTAHLLATGWRDGTMVALTPKAFELIGVERSPITKPVPNEEIISPEARKAIWEAQFASSGMTAEEMSAQVERSNAFRRNNPDPEPTPKTAKSAPQNRKFGP